MIGISDLSTNSIWKTLYTSSVVNNIKSGSSNTNQLDYNFQSLQSLSDFTMKTIQAQQEKYRTQINDFTTSVSGISSSAKQLTSANFLSQKYVSAESSAAVTGEAKSGANIAQYSIGISQVAMSQENAGKTLSSSAYGAVSKGISTLGITVGNGAERQVSVNILATDTNGQVLKKFANAINTSDTSVQAEVKTKNNQQYLSITSKETGSTTGFVIRDIHGSSATALELGNKVQDGTDASYTINGTSYKSGSNKVSLDNGNVTLTLNTKTTGNIKVDVGKDNNKVVDTVQKLIDNYNQLNTVLSQSDSVTKRGEKALSSVESLVGKTMATSFANIGITVDKSTGNLQLDDKKLSTALTSSPDKVKSLLTGSASLGKAVERVSKELSTTSVNSYLKLPNVLAAFNNVSPYNSNGWLNKNSNLAQGLFLNMTV